MFEQDCVEQLGVALVDEEIDIFCSRKRRFQADIAFPVAVADPFLFKRVEEFTDSRFVRCI
jgi:hypothetical protein